MTTRTKSPLTKKSIKIMVECWLDQYESQRSDLWDSESYRLWVSSIKRLRAITPAIRRWQSATHPTRSWAIGKAWNHLQTRTSGQFATPGSTSSSVPAWFVYAMDDMVMDAMTW